MGSELGGLLVTMLVVALLIIGRKRLEHLDVDDLAMQLRNELKGRIPVYSAETTAGNEAEFIRDRLPRRFSAWLFLVFLGGLVTFGGLAWWLTR
jgi:hypothetical protein